MDKLAKGNIIVATRRFIDSELEPEQRQRVYHLMPEDVRAVLPDVKRSEWHPNKLASAQWAALAQSQPSEKESLELLERCGRFIGHDATNTFLRLVVRLLTPAMFVSKFPRIWEKDFKFGRIETAASDVSKNEIVLDIKDVEGFDFFAHTACGWFSQAMEAMGCKNVVARHDVSFERPGPRDLSVRLSWAA